MNHHLVATAEGAAATLAKCKTLVRIEHVKVIARDIAVAHKTFGNRIVDGNVNAPFFDARYICLETVTNAALQNPAAAHLDGDALHLHVLDFVCRNQVADFNHAVHAFCIDFLTLAGEFTMAPKVGITADRRSEVAVILPVQGEVPEAVGVVVSLLHTAQNAVRERLVASGALDQVFVKLEGYRVQVCIATARLAQVTQHHRSVLEQVRVHVIEFHDILRVWSFMDTVNALQLALLEFLRAAVVSNEHAFFDPRIGIVVFARENLDRFTVFVKLATVFSCLEFEQAILGAVSLEKCRHFGESLDGIVAFFHHLHCLLVRDALRDVHDTAMEIPTENVCFLVQVDHAGECATVYAFVQAANAARKLFREHRHCRPRQVLRITSFKSFFVEVRSFRHVVAHVGDVHAELVTTIRLAFHADSIVVVHGAFGVNAENVELAVIHAALEILFGRVRNGCHVLFNGGAEALGQVALFHELFLDFVPSHVHDFGGAVHLCQVAVLELRVRIKREADGLAFLARRLPAVAHLVHLAGIDFGHLPVFVTGLVQNAALHACAGILFGLTAAACARTAVVFDTLLCKLLAALFALVFERFAIAQLVFLVGRTL